ncbi:hypothetical protein B7494_g1964 [Chlorociboria aeruginascens]|nr:hypothetical protein B7494_g1964 [Chlorociboria aeruginascens]
MENGLSWGCGKSGHGLPVCRGPGKSEQVRASQGKSRQVKASQGKSRHAGERAYYRKERASDRISRGRQLGTSRVASTPSRKTMERRGWLERQLMYDAPDEGFDGERRQLWYDRTQKREAEERSRKEDPTAARTHTRPTVLCTTPFPIIFNALCPMPYAQSPIPNLQSQSPIPNPNPRGSNCGVGTVDRQHGRSVVARSAGQGRRWNLFPPTTGLESRIASVPHHTHHTHQHPINIRHNP